MLLPYYKSVLLFLRKNPCSRDYHITKIQKCPTCLSSSATVRALSSSSRSRLRLLHSASSLSLWRASWAEQTSSSSSCCSSSRLAFSSWAQRCSDTWALSCSWGLRVKSLTFQLNESVDLYYGDYCIGWISFCARYATNNNFCPVLLFFAQSSDLVPTSNLVVKDLLYSNIIVLSNSVSLEFKEGQDKVRKSWHC